MKWLSVKKYKPPHCEMCVLVLVEAASGHSFLELAFFKDGEWISREDKESFESLVQKVTHFCIPDAVEIEEE